MHPDLVLLELFSLLLCSLCPQIWISFQILPHCLHCHFTNDEIWSAYSNVITNIWSICVSCYSNNVSTDTMARPPVCSLNKVDMSPSVCVCVCLSHLFLSERYVKEQSSVWSEVLTSEIIKSKSYKNKA